VSAVFVVDVLRLLLGTLQRRGTTRLLAARVLHRRRDEHRDAVVEPLDVLRIQIGKDHHLDGAGLIVEDELRHQLPFVRPLLDLRLLHLRHDPADVHRLIDEPIERVRGRVREELQLFVEFVERMTGDVEAERFLLVAQPLVLGPFSGVLRQRRSFRTRRR
jgi:hypothetical protein